MKLIRIVLIACVLLLHAPILVAAEAGPATGTVAETTESGGYVYIKFEDGQWIAANSFPVSVGDKIEYSGAMVMTDFHSKSLDRTFDSILFVSQANPVGGDGAGHPAMPMEGHGSQDMQIQKAAAVQSPVAGEIAALADGKTVAAIYAESGQLKDQVVSLNARVIKISKNIMGRNWITLQDGTGTESDNKLLATSQEEVAPGDLVVVKGTVNTDIDLGYGYKYAVLLEEASFSAGQE
jgi:hypothetical protein